MEWFDKPVLSLAEGLTTNGCDPSKRGEESVGMDQKEGLIPTKGLFSRKVVGGFLCVRKDSFQVGYVMSVCCWSKPTNRSLCLSQDAI